MTEHPRIRVVAPTPYSDDTRIYLVFDDTRPDIDITRLVQTITLDGAPRSGWTATITTPAVIEIETLESDEVQWVGLERVPSVAMQAELDRRDAEFFLAAAGIEDSDG